MRLRELIFQGVLGADRPCRLRPEGTLAQLELPQDVTVGDVHDLLVACLFPKHLTEDCRQRLQFGDSVKLAAVLETGDSGPVFRIIRRSAADSVRLQRKASGGYEDLVSGASDVQSALRNKLKLPRLRVFFPLNLWRFSADEVPAPAAGAQYGDDPQIPEVVDQYLTALEVESVEDELKSIEQNIEESEQALGEGRKLEKKIERAQEKLDDIDVDAVSEEDIEFLNNKEDRLDEFETEFDRLRSQEDEELEKIHDLLPGTPLRSPVFWAGIAVALVAIVASFIFHESYRILALGSIPGWAVAGFDLLHYYNNRGRASLRKVRLNSIRRRLNQVREQEILFRDRVEHMLMHAGVDDEMELLQRLPKARKLREAIEQLEDELRSIEGDPQYRKARSELDSLRARRRQLQERRQEMPDFVMNSFQLEQDLEELGVDPDEVRQKGRDGDGDTVEFDSPFKWLRAVAQWTDQWDGSGLVDSARSTWSKICGHVLGDRFDDVDLTADGGLEVGSLTDEQRELWQKTRTAEVQAVVAALALALHVDGRRRQPEQTPGSVWIGPPEERMTSGHAENFKSVFRSAAKQSQIVICEPS